VLPAKGAVLDLLHELARLGIALDPQLPTGHFDRQVARQESAGEDDFLRVLADVDETACAG